MVTAFVSCLHTGALALQASHGAQLPCVAQHFPRFYKGVRAVVARVWEVLQGDAALDAVRG